jgi:hypothetical protein
MPIDAIRIYQAWLDALVRPNPQPRISNPTSPLGPPTLPEQCNICYDPLIFPVKIEVCNHIFDRHCIRRWRSSNQDYHLLCPMCRRPMTQIRNLSGEVVSWTLTQDDIDLAGSSHIDAEEIDSIDLALDVQTLPSQGEVNELIERNELALDVQVVPSQDEVQIYEDTVSETERDRRSELINPETNTIVQDIRSLSTIELPFQMATIDAAFSAAGVWVMHNETAKEIIGVWKQGRGHQLHVRYRSRNALVSNLYAYDLLAASKFAQKFAEFQRVNGGQMMQKASCAGLRDSHLQVLGVASPFQSLVTARNGHEYQQTPTAYTKTLVCLHIDQENPANQENHNDAWYTASDLKSHYGKDKILREISEHRQKTGQFEPISPRPHNLSRLIIG